VRCVAAVVADPGNLQVPTIDEVAAAAWVAFETVSTMPSDADTIAEFPIARAFADRVDYSGDFVSRRARIGDAWPRSLFRKKVAMAYSARLYLNPDLAARWLDDFFVEKFEGTFGLLDSNGFHIRVSMRSSVGDSRITRFASYVIANGSADRKDARLTVPE
jgi:hypothetical protein